VIVTERLRPHVFRLPIEKIRAGYKSDIYFARTKLILERDQRHDRVTMQVFQKHPDAVVVGTDQTLAILHVGTGHYRDRRKADALFDRYLSAERRLYTAWTLLPAIDWSAYEPVAREVFEISRELASMWEPGWAELEVTSLYDGETAKPHEPVMHIEGKYVEFAHLETLYLGALSEGTRVATNTREVVAAARGKPVIMFGARHQVHEAQAGSGYAAFVGGASAVSTDEQGEWWGSTGLGTVPHALIAVYGGDTTVATLKFDEYINRAPDAVGHLTAKGTAEGHVNVTSLVDFNNDVVNTSLGVAHALGARLWGVRVDTSESLVDRALLRELEEKEGVATAGAGAQGAGAPGRGAELVEPLRGVTPRLVELLREALDQSGYKHVRIVASGGFDAEKIRRFEELGVPVDVYGVGSALVHGSGFDHTADIVRVEGRPLAKTGRRYMASERLHPVDWPSLIGEPDWARSSS
jgi:nicotinate phosphoribosyltransferase